MPYKNTFTVLIGASALILVGLFANVEPAWSGPPTNALKTSIDEVIKILEDPAMRPADKREERRKLLEQTVGQRFNYEEMARRTIGSEWAKHSAEQRKAFVESFQTLLTNTYIGRIENYSGEKVHYLKEITDGDYAEVRTEINTGKSVIPIDYKLENRAGEWRVYDVVVEGTGLVQNYREQFKRILRKESFEALSKYLREKADKTGKNDAP